MLSTINNKIALCEHKAGVFYFSVLQLLDTLSHIIMCQSALRHRLLYSILVSPLFSR
jgi:hypothetical protein